MLKTWVGCYLGMQTRKSRICEEKEQRSKVGSGLMKTLNLILNV